MALLNSQAVTWYSPAEQSSRAELLMVGTVTQISFAEYHSKQSFVQRRESVFSIMAHWVVGHSTNSSSRIEKTYWEYGEYVKKATTQGSFGGNPLLNQCWWGIKSSNYVFTDGKDIQNFLSLSEEGKPSFHHEPILYRTDNTGLLSDCLEFSFLTIPKKVLWTKPCLQHLQEL